MLLSVPFISSGQRQVIADIQFNGPPNPPAVIAINPPTNCGNPVQGFLGLRGGALVFNDVEGSQCCPCFVGGPNDCGNNDNQVQIGPVITAGACNISIRVEVSFVEGNDGLECADPQLATFACNPNSGADGLDISFNAQNLGSFIPIGTFCGNTPVEGNWTPLSATSGFFEVTNIQTDLLFLNAIGGTQALDEEYRIDRILVEGDPFSAVPASINVTNDMPCNGMDALILTAIGGNAGSSFMWSRDGTPLTETSATLNLGIADMTASGTYQVEILDPNGCRTIGSAVVNVQDCAAPIPDFTGLDDIFCRDFDQLSLPSVSTNGIPGTWNVSNDLILRDTVIFNTLVFTPDPSTGANTVNIPIRIDEIPVFGDFPPNGKDICFFSTPGQTQTFDLIDEFSLVPSDLLDITFNGMTTSTEQEWRSMEVPSNPGSFDVEIFTLPFGACGRIDTMTQLNVSFIDMAQDNQETICFGDLTPLNFSALVQSGDPNAVWSDLFATGADLSDPRNVDLSFLPVGQYNFQYDLNPTVSCNLSDQAMLTIDIIDFPTRTISPSGLCSGDGFSINIDGVTYDESFPFDEIFIQNPSGPCDSMIVVDLMFDVAPTRTINPPPFCQGDVFTYNGVDYTNDQNIVVSVPGPTPCDSMNELILTFIPSVTESITIDTLCDGTPFDFRGTTYTQSDIVSLTFPGMNGECDTSATLELTFNPVPMRSLVRPDLCNGSTFTFDGVDYTRDTTATISIANPAGTCDSLIMLELTFNAVPERSVIPTDLCEGDPFTFDGVDYFSDTVAMVTRPNPGGSCDSLITLDLSFSAPFRMPITASPCEGDTIFVDNVAYTESFVGDVRVPDINGGCDTIFSLDLSFIQLIRTTLSPDLCEGDPFSYSANGNTYAEGQLLTGTERVLGPNGCDSIITIDLFFKPNSETRFEEIRNSGDSFSQVINGTLYDESNPIDTINLPSANGCDSTIFVNFIFVQGVFDSLIRNECTGSGFSVPGGPNGPYDEANPSGIDTFMLADGRDSFFITRITFQDPGINRFMQTLTIGDPFSIDFNGETYDASNPMGRDTLVGAAANGCDSIIVVSLNFVDAFTTVIDTMLCQGDPFSVDVDGITFNESNPDTTITLQTADGIDSIITVDLVFREPDTSMISTPRCIGDGFSITVGPDTYDENFPSGITPLINSVGCDSIVIVDLQFTSGVTVARTDTICSGTTLMIGSTVYGENTQLSGTEVLTAAAGCDSTITVDLTVDTIHFELITEPICPDADMFDFSIINTRPGQNLTALIDGIETMVIDTVSGTLPIGTQDLVLTNDGLCGTMPPFDISFHPAETLDIFESASTADSLTLAFDFSGIVSTVIWMQDSTEICVDCTSVNVSSSESATYTVQLMDDLGCTYTASFDVMGDDPNPPPPPPPPPPALDTMDFFLPNVISANVSAPNTLFFLQTTNPSIIDYDLRIFNRWGNLVSSLSNLTPNDPNFGWDGRSNSGELQPSGVYVYVVVIRREDSGEQTLAGDLLLMQ